PGRRGTPARPARAPARRPRSARSSRSRDTPYRPGRDRAAGAGKPDSHRRAAAGRARDVESAARLLHVALGNGEPETRSLGPRREERLAKVGVNLGSDTGP